MCKCAKINITMRNATPADSEFAFSAKKAAFKIYVDTVSGWDETAQRQLHAQRFQTQDFRVIRLAGADVGVLVVVITPDCLTVNQLFILPEHQGKGIGRRCMLSIMEEARQLGVPVRLRVIKVNQRALAFYHRLNFVCIGETDTHFAMAWSV